MNLLPHLENFANEITREKIEIYNEASVQFELAIYLRNFLSNGNKIQLERNIKYFNFYNGNYLKKEMDIVIFTQDKKERQCIELKFPTQGQYPEQMFSACKDVKFLEQLVKSGFNKCYFMMFAINPLFYTNRSSDSGIYKMFRSEKIIKGEVRKPTRKNGKVIDETLDIDGEYKIDWRILKDNLKCFIIEVKI